MILTPRILGQAIREAGGGAEELFAEFGFVRDRQIAKWRWVMRTEL